MPPTPATPRNVLLLTIDSLRADMPWTGYSRAIAPNLTRLADESVVYTNEYALSSYTAKTKLVSNGGVEVLPLEVIAETA